jgi:hypothetical protein
MPSRFRSVTWKRRISGKDGTRVRAIAAHDWDIGALGLTDERFFRQFEIKDFSLQSLNARAAFCAGHDVPPIVKVGHFLGENVPQLVPRHQGDDVDCQIFGNIEIEIRDAESGLDQRTNRQSVSTALSHAVISFIANIARKRPELKQGKTTIKP